MANDPKWPDYDVHFGTIKPKPDPFAELPPDDEPDPDDEPLPGPTDPGLIAILGFDPKELDEEATDPPKG